MVSLPHISSLHAVYPELFQRLQQGAIYTSRQPPTSILARKSRHVDGFIQEATEVELHLHINRRNGVSLC